MLTQHGKSDNTQSLVFDNFVDVVRMEDSNRQRKL